MTNTICCANDPCESKATCAIENGTPLCSTCCQAYVWGQAHPLATIYDVDSLLAYRAYCLKWPDSHDPGIPARLDFADFAPLLEVLTRDNLPALRRLLLEENDE